MKTTLMTMTDINPRGDTMKMTGNISDQGDQLGLPWDLREWFGEFTLLRWIEEDVETLEWDNGGVGRSVRLGSPAGACPDCERTGIGDGRPGDARRF